MINWRGKDYQFWTDALEELQTKVEALEVCRDWINTDLSYKAPEQITVDLFASYLDMMFGELAATKQDNNTDTSSDV